MYILLILYQLRAPEEFGHESGKTSYMSHEVAVYILGFDLMVSQMKMHSGKVQNATYMLALKVAWNIAGGYNAAPAIQ